MKCSFKNSGLNFYWYNDQWKIVTFLIVTTVTGTISEPKYRQGVPETNWALMLNIKYLKEGNLI